MGIWEIPNFTKGKTQSRAPGFAPPEPFLVTVVTRDSIDAFLGTRNERERVSQLRKLRALGAFSFQTQALFDASVPGLPHFVYTDHTGLANTYCPDFDARTSISRRPRSAGWPGNARSINTPH